MKYRYKLFSGKNPYDVSRGEKYFLAAMRENLKFQIENCPKYAEIARAAGFTPECLQSEDELYKIPPVTTLYLKRNRLFSLPESRLVIINAAIIYSLIIMINDHMKQIAVKS